MTTKGSAAKDAGKLRVSAGILVFRNTAAGTEVLLGHPGGPFWKNKDEGSWTIPKGEPGKNEDYESAALREFAEETGWTLDATQLKALGEVRQKSGKRVYAWLVEGSRPAEELVSNAFELEWPPGSDKRQSFPEMDRFAWFSIAEARKKINPAQTVFLDGLENK